MAETTDSATATEGNALSTDDAWTILLALADRAKRGEAITVPTPIGYSDDKTEIDASSDVVLHVDPEAPRCWYWDAAVAGQQDTAVASMLDIYMPLCVGEVANTLVIAHLGQSLDGRIATRTGASQFITGDENIVHTHRLRALFDAVLVGANTASTDNPRLTTRRASGDNATRVLLDPQCSVDPEASIFTDGIAKTMVLCDSGFMPAEHVGIHIGLKTTEGFIPPKDIIAALHEQGLKRIFVEGGGVTVSQFLQAGALHRLHVCVAPMIIGSGRPSFQLPEVDALDQCIFLKAQHFTSGDDLLFDCQLRRAE
jgi:diaminohydroxyphosphoribosylaminopyrimidine deaminase/5-amino-6-(5-phosphoribosylamino)uracil reductase